MTSRALDTRSKYGNADDQVAYLLGKTVRLAEYLRIGLGAVDAATGRLQGPDRRGERGVENALRGTSPTAEPPESAVRG
jgi:hypothetical protein